MNVGGWREVDLEFGKNCGCCRARRRSRKQKIDQQEKTVDKNTAFSGYLEKFAALGVYLQRIQYKIRSFWSQKSRYLNFFSSKVESNVVL